MSTKFPRLYKKRAKIAKALKSQSLLSFFYVILGILKSHIVQLFLNLKYSYKDTSLPILPQIHPVFDRPVTIIIPFRDNIHLLERCLNSIFDRTSYNNFNLILINNRSVEAKTAKYLSSIKNDPLIRILDYDKSFNYSDMHNWAMNFVQTENILLLNNDTEVITPNWLESLTAWIEQEKVGAVGALLLFPNGTVQHAGVGLYPEIACHLYEGESPNGDNKSSINQCRELYAVTGACMMTKRNLFEGVQGMDSANLPVNFNDVDYCLKLRQRGYKIVFEPSVKLYHHESYTRGNAWTQITRYRSYKKEHRFFWKKWKKYIGDIVK
ncbi:MAG: glycosyltransferase [Candidatus Paceibacterota bacterium]|jgi:GT2 family glycosyltransferase